MSIDTDLVKKHKEELPKPRRRLKLQKVDKDTNELIDDFKAYLFSIGLRLTREKVWQILQKAHKLPYEFLINRNRDGIEYQGQGRHISSKHGNQLMVIKELGRYEVKAINDRSGDNNYSASIKFKPSQDIIQEIKDKIPVINES